MDTSPVPADTTVAAPTAPNVLPSSISITEQIAQLRVALRVAEDYAVKHRLAANEKMLLGGVARKNGEMVPAAA